MSVEYTRRALADVARISGYYFSRAGAATAEKFEQRLRAVVERVERRPQTAPAVEGQTDLRVTPMLTFPYKVFFQELGPGKIRVLHIRHMSRRPVG